MSRCVKTPVTGAQILPRKSKRPLAWQDAQLTPEISIDLELSGNAVLRSDVERLKAALRAQATVLRPFIR